MTFSTLPDIYSFDFWVENIKSDLRFQIDEQFRKNNIEIPFPQRDVHLKSKNIEG